MKWFHSVITGGPMMPPGGNVRQQMPMGGPPPMGYQHPPSLMRPPMMQQPSGRY